MSEQAAREQLRADRYGAAPRKLPRWFPLVLGVVVVLAGLGVAYLGYDKYGPKDIESEQLGYVVVDDSTLSVRLKVTRKDPAKPVVCFVRAMNGDTVEVGRREVLIEPSASGTVEVSTTVRSSSRPSSGSIYACTDQVPKYLRAG
ncbi:DUF4307 domain-containing protein [Nocardia sp. NPDC052566]|uniref:DUF4307 domain-containing protein n=1 Tax=Nocardia sp. NPDC052566 TaxID=3364330 RepID=UPI0037CBD5E9